MADERKECAHAGCVCMAGADSAYCSSYCEAAAGNIVSDEVTTIRCECGHQGCS